MLQLQSWMEIENTRVDELYMADDWLQVFNDKLFQKISWETLRAPILVW